MCVYIYAYIYMYTFKNCGALLADNLVFLYFCICILFMAIPPSCSTGTEGPRIQFVLEYIEHPARCLMGTETSAV